MKKVNRFTKEGTLVKRRVGHTKMRISNAADGSSRWSKHIDADTVGIVLENRHPSFKILFTTGEIEEHWSTSLELVIETT